MPISIDRLFGNHAEALTLRVRRGEVLASNLANVDTPYYKARHLYFISALKRIQDQQAVNLSKMDTGQVQDYREGVYHTLQTVFTAVMQALVHNHEGCTSTVSEIAESRAPDL
jgi:flagellar basal-body rod protein FlgB